MIFNIIGARKFKFLYSFIYSFCFCVAFGQFFVAIIYGLIMLLFFLLDNKVLENKFLLELLVCKLSNLEILQLVSNSLGELCYSLSENLPLSNFRSFLQDLSFPFGVLYSSLAPYEVCYFNVAFLETKSVNANDIAIRLTVAFTIWYPVVNLLIVLKPAFTRDKRMAFAFSAVVPRFSISLWSFVLGEKRPQRRTSWNLYKFYEFSRLGNNMGFRSFTYVFRSCRIWLRFSLRLFGILLCLSLLVVVLLVLLSVSFLQKFLCLRLNFFLISHF